MDGQQETRNKLESRERELEKYRNLVGEYDSYSVLDRNLVGSYSILDRNLVGSYSILDRNPAGSYSILDMYALEQQLSRSKRELESFKRKYRVLEQVVEKQNLGIVQLEQDKRISKIKLQELEVERSIVTDSLFKAQKMGKSSSNSDNQDEIKRLMESSKMVSSQYFFACKQITDYMQLAELERQKLWNQNQYIMRFAKSRVSELESLIDFYQSQSKDMNLMFTGALDLLSKISKESADKVVEDSLDKLFSAVNCIKEKLQTEYKAMDDKIPQMDLNQIDYDPFLPYRTFFQTAKGSKTETESLKLDQLSKSKISFLKKSDSKDFNISKASGNQDREMLELKIKHLKLELMEQKLININYRAEYEARHLPAKSYSIKKAYEEIPKMYSKSFDENFETGKKLIDANSNTIGPLISSLMEAGLPDHGNMSIFNYKTQRAYKQLQICRLKDISIYPTILPLLVDQGTCTNFISKASITSSVGDKSFTVSDRNEEMNASSTANCSIGQSTSPYVRNDQVAKSTQTKRHNLLISTPKFINFVPHIEEAGRSDFDTDHMFSKVKLPDINLYPAKVSNTGSQTLDVEDVKDYKNRNFQTQTEKTKSEISAVNAIDIMPSYPLHKSHQTLNTSNQTTVQKPEHYQSTASQTLIPNLTATPVSSYGIKSKMSEDGTHGAPLVCTRASQTDAVKAPETASKRECAVQTRLSKKNTKLSVWKSDIHEFIPFKLTESRSTQMNSGDNKSVSSQKVAVKENLKISEPTSFNYIPIKLNESKSTQVEIGNSIPIFTQTTYMANLSVTAQTSLNLIPSPKEIRESSPLGQTDFAMQTDTQILEKSLLNSLDLEPSKINSIGCETITTCTDRQNQTESIAFTKSTQADILIQPALNICSQSQTENHSVNHAVQTEMRSFNELQTDANVLSMSDFVSRDLYPSMKASAYSQTILLDSDKFTQVDLKPIKELSISDIRFETVSKSSGDQSNEGTLEISNVGHHQYFPETKSQRTLSIHNGITYDYAAISGLNAESQTFPTISQIEKDLERRYKGTIERLKNVVSNLENDLAQKDKEIYQLVQKRSQILTLTPVRNVVLQKTEEKEIENANLDKDQLIQNRSSLLEEGKRDISTAEKYTQIDQPDKGLQISIPNSNLDSPENVNSDQSLSAEGGRRKSKQSGFVNSLLVGLWNESTEEDDVNDLMEISLEDLKKMRNDYFNLKKSSQVEKSKLLAEIRDLQTEKRNERYLVAHEKRQLIEHLERHFIQREKDQFERHQNILDKLKEIELINEGLRSQLESKDENVLVHMLTKETNTQPYKLQTFTELGCQTDFPELKETKETDYELENTIKPFQTKIDELRDKSTRSEDLLAKMEVEYEFQLQNAFETIAKLRSQLSINAIQSADRLKSEKTIKEGELLDAERKLNDLQVIIDRMQIENLELRAKYEKIKSLQVEQVVTGDQVSTSKTDHVDEFQEINERYESIIGNLQYQNDCLSRDIAELRTRSNHLVEQNNTLHEKIETLEAEKVLLESDLEEYVRYEDFKRVRKNEKINPEMESLKALYKICLAEKRLNESEVMQLSKEVETLKKKNTELLGDAAVFDALKNGATASVGMTIQPLDTIRHTDNPDTNDLDESDQSVKDKFSELQDEVYVKNNHIMELEKEKIILTHNLQTLKTEKKNLAEKLERLSIDYNDALRQKSKFEHQVTLLTARVAEQPVIESTPKVSNMQQLPTTESSLKEKNMDNERTQLLQRMKENESNLENSLKALQESEKQNAVASSELESIREKLIKEEEKTKNLVKELQASKITFGKIQRKNAELNEKIGNFQKQFIRLSSKLNMPFQSLDILLNGIETKLDAPSSIQAAKESTEKHQDVSKTQLDRAGSFLTLLLKKDLDQLSTITTDNFLENFIPFLKLYSFVLMNLINSFRGKALFDQKSFRMLSIAKCKTPWYLLCKKIVDMNAEFQQMKRKVSGYTEIKLKTQLEKQHAEYTKINHNLRKELRKQTARVVAMKRIKGITKKFANSALAQTDQILLDSCSTQTELLSFSRLVQTGALTCNKCIRLKAENIRLKTPKEKREIACETDQILDQKWKRKTRKLLADNTRLRQQIKLFECNDTKSSKLDQGVMAEIHVFSPQKVLNATHTQTDPIKRINNAIAGEVAITSYQSTFDQTGIKNMTEKIYNLEAECQKRNQVINDQANFLEEKELHLSELIRECEYLYQTLQEKDDQISRITLEYDSTNSILKQQVATLDQKILELNNLVQASRHKKSANHKTTQTNIQNVDKNTFTEQFLIDDCTSPIPSEQVSCDDEFQRVLKEIYGNAFISDLKIDDQSSCKNSDQTDIFDDDDESVPNSLFNYSDIHSYHGLSPIKDFENVFQESYMDDSQDYEFDNELMNIKRLTAESLSRTMDLFD